MDFTIGVNSSREDLDQVTIHQMDLRRTERLAKVKKGLKK